MAETVAIGRRFCGPPESANGGYACGLVARRIDSPAAEVTLRLPPPLERELVLDGGEDGRVELRDGELLIADGQPLEALDIKLPEPISLSAAKAARDVSPLHDHHPWPTCFVCGPDRRCGDGMRVICGPVEDRELVASPWETDGLPVEGGALAPEMVWAALDCPSGLALMQTASPAWTRQPPGAGSGTVSALGRLSAEIDSGFEPGETYVAVGWPIDRDGRKHFTGSAIFGQGGRALAWARAVWIELRDEMLGART